MEAEVLVLRFLGLLIHRKAPRPAPQLGDTWAALLAQAGVDSAPGSARLFHVWISLKQRHAAAPASRARADAILAGARRPADALALRVPRTVDFLPSELGPNTFFVDGDFFDTASDAERQQIFKRRVLARAGLAPAPHAAAPPAPPNAALNVAAKVFTPSAEVVAYAYRMSKLGASDARVAAKLHQLRARALACLN